MSGYSKKVIKIKKSEKTKQLILHTALDCFSEKGYKDTSTKRIAQEAGIAEGLIFNYFKTKKSLYDALIDPILYDLLPKNLEKFMNQNDSRNNFDEFLFSFYKNRYVYVLVNFKKLKLLFSEIAFNEKKKEEFLSLILNKELNPLFKILSDYRKRGEIDSRIKIKNLIVDLISQFFTSIIKSKLFYNKKITENYIDKEVSTMVEHIKLLYGGDKSDRD